MMPSCVEVTPPQALSYFTFGYSVVLGIATIVGNGLILLAALVNPNKNLRTPFNFFLFNLAISDLAVGLVTIPISAIIHYLEANSQSLASTSQVLHMSMFISTGASILSLAAMALDRLIAIGWPMVYRKHQRVSRSAVVSIAIWMFSAVLCIPYFKLGYIDFLIVFANVSIAIAIIALFVSYMGVYRKMSTRHASIYKRRTRSLKKSSVNVVSNVPRKSLQELFQEAPKKTNILLNRQKKMVVKAFLTLLLAFLALSGPAVVMIYMLQFCEQCDCLTIHIFRDVTFVLLLTPSAVNPYLCALRMNKFKAALFVMIKGRSSEKWMDCSETSKRPTEDNGDTKTASQPSQAFTITQTGSE